MGDYWQLTAELYGNLITKPKMSEKHLTKPPFRYLADVILETINATGYAQGLYEGDDMNSKTITDRDAKLLWLEKIIKVTCYAKGEKIDVKATKIIAGLEPEKTNSFLQIMHACATSGKDTGKIVAKVRSKLEGAAQKEEQQDAGEAQGGNEEEEQKEREREEKKRRAAEKKRRQEEKAEQERIAREQEEAAEQARLDEERAAAAAAAEEDQRRKKKKEEKRRAEEKRKAEERAAEEEAAAAATATKQKARVERPTTASKKPSKVSSNTKEVDSRIDKSRVPQGVIRDDDDEEDENDMIIQNEDADVLGAGVKLDEVDRAKQGKFVRNAMEEHDEQTREEENRKAEPEAKSGGIKMSMPSRKAKTNKLGTSTKADSKDRGSGMSQNDIEFMRNAIQSLCQATNPLGKSMDFVQDDIESMTKENDYWRKEYNRSQARLDEEMRVTEESLQPMYDKLAEVEEKIREQVSKINNVRAQIIKNDSTVQSLLSGVVNPRQ